MVLPSVQTNKAPLASWVNGEINGERYYCPFLLSYYCRLIDG